MAVTLIGTPANTHAATTTVTGTWGSGQNRATGNLLIALVTASGGTAAAMTFAQAAGTTGWTQLATVTNNASSAHAAVSVWSKTATSGDAAPGFTAVASGTTAMDCILFEFAGANTASPLGASGTYASGASSSTVTFAATTTAPVATAGEYALAVFAQESGSGSNLTWNGTGTGWTNVLNGNGVASRLQTAVDQRAAPPSGTALADSGAFSTNTTAFGAGIVIVLAAQPAYLLPAPARAPVPRVFSKGRIASSPGAPVNNPASPAPFYPRNRPVRVPAPLSPRGRVAGSPGSPVSNPPPAPSLTCPVRARIPAPWPRGHTASTPATPVRSSPVVQTQFSPLNKAARAQPAMFRKGRITSAPGVPPVNPVPANTWHAPVRALIPQRPAGGRTRANAGAPVRNPVTRLVTLTAGDLHLRWETASGSGRWQTTPGNGRWDTADGPGRWLEREHAPDWTEAST